MAVWKQLLIALVVLAAAGLAWVKFVPGSDAVLARWGIDWAQAAAPQQQAGQRAAQGGQSGAGQNAQGQNSGGQNGGRQGRGPQTAVVTAAVATATINDRLQAIGTGVATKSVIVNPYVSGRLMDVTVASGARVEAGDVIATLDSEAEEITLDRAKIAVADAQSRLDRINALRSSNTATQVQVTDAELVVANARLAQRDAELALERRSIVAPIAGIVGIMPVEAGNYVTSQTAIATIDDRSSIKVDFWVPERFADAVKVGADLEAFAIARPDKLLTGKVSAVDNRLDEQSRTLRVQALIDNIDDSLRAGMSFQVTMKFPGDAYPSVDPLAVQWGADGAFVWTIRDGKAARVPVRVVQRNTESVLVEAKLSPGETVVTQGIHTVREGAAVLVANADAPGGGS